MAESISDIQDVMTQRGIPVPENREAFLALYDYLIQTDEVPPAIDPAAAAAMGIDARRDPNGGFRINPDTP